MLIIDARPTTGRSRRGFGPGAPAVLSVTLALALATAASTANAGSTSLSGSTASQTPPYAAATSVSDPNQTDPNAASTSSSASDNADQTLSRQSLTALDESDGLGRSNSRNNPRNNTAEGWVDGTARKRQPQFDTDGIPVGSMVLRPSLTQTINSESVTGSATSSRTFLQTEIKGTLTSDWSRHQLTVTGKGVFQKNIAGLGEEKPSASIDADLRLDLADRTTAHLTAGYNFAREDTNDPNALANASVQAAVHTFNAGANVERNFGLFRGSTGLGLSRTIYGDAVLNDGSTVSLADRNHNAAVWTTRAGFNLSPALTPFVEVAVGRTMFDSTTDSSGYRRSSLDSGILAGVSLDLGEKFGGEIAAGYKRSDFDDSRLAALQSPALKGSVNWSPQRGTVITGTLQTQLVAGVTPGDSGYAQHDAQLNLTQQVRENLVATLGGGLTLRKYNAGEEWVYLANAGLAYSLTRSLDLVGSVGYQNTVASSGSKTGIFSAGMGLTLKR